MLRLLLLSVCLAAAARASWLDEEWFAFKQTHGKQYGESEDQLRRDIFAQNVAYIQKHNLEADRGVHTYWLGTNEYADMSNAEFRAMMNSYRPSNVSRAPQQHVPRSGDLPDSVDWRDKGYVTGVKNQGQCGSCWSFSATGSLEGQHFKSTGKLVSLSEQNLVDCSVKQGNHGCQGGLMDQAFDYIKKNSGIDTEESYPYKARNGKCQFNSANVGATLSSYTDVKSKSESDLQDAVASVGPISVAIDASHESFQLYSHGVYKPFFCSETKLDHGVLAVGYGSDGDKLYWLVKNSWGPSWGMKGYINMVRNDRNKCGIATQASYPVV